MSIKKSSKNFPDPLAKQEEKTTKPYGLKFAKAIEKPITGIPQISFIFLLSIPFDLDLAGIIAYITGLDCFIECILSFLSSYILWMI